MWTYLHYNVKLKPNKNCYAQENFKYIKIYKRKQGKIV